MLGISSRALINTHTKRGLATLVDKSRTFLQSEPTKKAIRAAIVELRPPTPAEIPRAIGDAVKLFTKSNWRDVTVRDAWRNTLVTTEVLCWFFVGECIGKGTLIGYQV